MVSLAGIIHPQAFQTRELIPAMTPAFSLSTSFQNMRHKNLELGIWDADLATNEKKTIWAMIDGTIHNSFKLKAELKNQRGYHFTSDTDAELIVHAYDAWQEEFLEHLNGDFAIALFDEKKESLYLIRDRLGKKNLYWTDQGEYWLFSTEIKGLLSSGLVPQTPSVVGLASYLYFSYIPQDFSPIKGVNKLLPGHFLKVDLRKRTSMSQYWSFSHFFEAKKTMNKEKAEEEFGRLFEDSVHISIPEHGTIGTFLLDNPGSFALTWHLSHSIHKERILGLNADFGPNKSSSIANLLNISFQSKTIEPEHIFQDLVKIIWYLDEPIASLDALKTWYMAKLSEGNTTVILGDAGWSELLAGSYRYFSCKQEESPSFYHRLALLPKKVLDSLVIPISRALSLNQKWRILRNIDINQAHMAYLSEIALFKPKERKKVSPFLFTYFDPEIFSQRFHRLSTIPGKIDPFLYFDAKTFLPDSTLTQYERLLSPFSISLAAPFLDHRFVQWIATISEEIKFEGNEPASILKKHLQKICPECITPSEKEEHFLENWCLNPAFRSLFSYLEKGFLVQEGFISPRWIKQQLGYPYLVPQTFKQLWSLLVLEIWFRLYIARPIGSSPLDINIKDFLRLK